MDKDKKLNYKNLELQAEEMTDINSYASISGATVSSIACAATALTVTSTITSVGTASSYFPG
ncbi:hypothetical protein OBCHQ24_04780 [Oceanobacillus iheyensis]|nr:hypothetical protein OBCHQ24_04780 [Oceanobacillus iheyensis]